MTTEQTEAETSAAPAIDSFARAAQLVRSLLAVEIQRLRQSGQQAAEDPYRGLYIGEDDVDRILQGDGPANGRDVPSGPLQDIALLAQSDTRLNVLQSSFGLTLPEVVCLVFCWVVERNLEIERLVAYAQDDVTKRRPRVDLLIRLIGDDGDAARQTFENASPLRRFRLIQLLDEPGQPSTPLASSYIALDGRVASFLAGSAEVDPVLEPLSRLEATADLPDVQLQLPSKASSERRQNLPPLVHGPDGAKLRSASAALIEGKRERLLTVDFGRLVQLEDMSGIDEAFARALREAVLQGAGLLLNGVDTLAPIALERCRALLANCRLTLPIIVGAKESIGWPGVEYEIAPPDFDERVALWTSQLGESLDDEAAEAVASRFRLYVDEITDSASAARGMAIVRSGDAKPDQDEIFGAARSQSAPILSDLATKVPQFYSWDDLILPEDTVEPLRELCASVEHRHTVYETWGFSRKLSAGKGVIALFAGESGTGKTMAADVVAGQLRLDLYKIDLSGVVSKYIGETEKNLKSVFDGAQRSNAILFFDEADALFGKRSEVKDAHDRYANIETAYLLQRMEQYEGVVILATNLRMNIDDAFLRRMHFVLDFPVPDERLRKQIWESVIPADLPVASDIDFAFLAKRFKLSGGNIRNIVLGAAFLAADESTSVGMSHLARSVRREYQKIGRMVTEAEFGPYWEFL